MDIFLIILIFIIIILLIFSNYIIYKNSNNLYFSIRSPNILYITNILIVLNFFIINLNLFKEFKEINSFYFIIQFFIIISISLKFLRLYLCIKINKKKDDLIHFNKFESKFYFFQYFYVRIIIIFLSILIILIIFISFKQIKTIQEILYPLSKIIHNNKQISSNYQFFWEFVFIIENFLLFTTCFFFINNELKKDLYLFLEIFIISIINFIYSNIYIISIFLFNDNKEKEKIKNYIIAIESIYFILLQFFSIFFPFILKYSNNSLNYDITVESTKNFYLFMSNKQCYNYFYNYLIKNYNNFNKIEYFLSLYLSIMNYNLIYLTNCDQTILAKEAHKIIETYFNINQDNKYFDSNTCYNIRNNTNLEIMNNNLKKDLFNNVLKICIANLYEKYENFLNNKEYKNLINDINYKTYLRCKLSKFYNFQLES